MEHDVCMKKHKITLRQTTEQENERLKLENASLRGENKALKEHPQTVNNNNNIVVGGIITDFNHEDVDHILKKIPDLLNTAITRHLTESVPFLTQEVHCNPTVFPEYCNIYVDKYNSPYAMVFQDKRFQRKMKKQTLDDVIETFIRMLGNYVDDHDFGQKILDRYERYRDSIEEGGDHRKELEDELVGILIDFGELYKMDQISQRKLKSYGETQVSSGERSSPIPSYTQ
jgi:hypothetical protein